MCGKVQCTYTACMKGMHCMYAQTYTLTQNTSRLQSTVKPVWDHLFYVLMREVVG